MLISGLGSNNIEIWADTTKSPKPTNELKINELGER